MGGWLALLALQRANPDAALVASWTVVAVVVLLGAVLLVGWVQDVLERPRTKRK